VIQAVRQKPDHVLLEAVGLRRLVPGGEKVLLNSVSISLHAGRTMGVMGPSGSGKTLLLRALAMLDPLDEGEIRFRGEVPRHAAIPRYRSQVVYLHQRPALPGATVEAALRRPFALAAHRDRAFDRDKVVAFLEQVGRDAAFLDKSTADLSGGEQQLTALVRAVQLDPAILLLDEPTASLDAGAARAIENLLSAWLAESPGERTFAWVGHNAEQTMRMTHEVKYIRGGRLVEEPQS